jgi:hypothetical protein
MRHIVSMKMGLELVPRDGVDFHMGVAIRLPPVGCHPIKLVHSKKDFLMIRALGMMRTSILQLQSFLPLRYLALSHDHEHNN